MPLIDIKHLALASVFVLAACSGDKHEQQGPDEDAAPFALSVETLQLVPTSIADVQEFSGRTVAYQEAEIRPQVSGVVTDRFFEGGESVAEGQPLIKIDDAEYQAAVARANAAVASAQSALNAATSRRDRLSPLVVSGAVSQQQFDDADAAVESAQAALDSQKAVLNTAQISLNRSTIKAPISGTISRPNVNIGALLSAGQPNAIATITQLDPMLVDLTVPSVQVLNYQERVESGALSVNEDGQVPVEIVLENGSVYPHKGSVDFVEARVDPGAGTVSVRTTVPNPDQTLLPGTFVRAKVSAGTLVNAILIPQSALVRIPRGGSVVYVLSADNTVEERPVVADSSQGNSWIVTQGLSGADQIIVSNLQKLQAGMPVTPVNDTTVTE